MNSIAMICFGDVRTPRNGYAIRCWTLARKLGASGNRVTIYQFTADDDYTTKDDIDIYSLAVRHEQPQVGRLAGVLGFDPLRELRFPREGYRRLAEFRSHIATADVIYLEGCLLLNGYLFAKRLHKPLVIDTHCINKDVALKLRKQHKLIGTLRVFIWHWLERTLLRGADMVIAISAPDQAFIEKHYGIDKGCLSLIPHEVSAAQAPRFAAEAAQLRERLGQGKRRIACFIGDLGAIQNKDSERYIRQVLAPRTPDVQYVLVGNNPDHLADQPNITYTGFVAAIDPYILAADFCIAPVAIGSGVKTKVLDYLKYQKPVVATPIAMEGIEPQAHTRIHELADFSTGVQALTKEAL